MTKTPTTTGRTCGLAFLLLLAACTVPAGGTSLLPDGGGDVFDIAGVDFSIAPGSIGSSCQASTDCTAGTAPVCWRSNILDSPGNLPTPGGYCSSTCTSDTDCGSTGSCQAVLAGSSKYCLRKCITANTCRNTEGYACFILTAHTGYCYPATRLSCNPTQIDPATKNGTCPGSNPPSACIRRTFEDLGECRPLCTPGSVPCSTAESLAQHCVYLNTSQSSTGAPTRDVFKGTTCFPVYSDAVKPGGTCKYFDECTDGYECNVVKAGDNTCRQLCTVGDSSCISPQTCRDAFSAGPGGAGLCL